MITELQKKAAQAMVNIFETSQPLGHYGKVALVSMEWTDGVFTRSKAN
jgi:hypothetical protein